MSTETIAPEPTAVRVALWRALHLQLDEPPFVFTDPIGEKLVDEVNWTKRPDMNPEFSKPMRASIVGRARFIEDLVEAQVARGIKQYVLMGAGLDSFAQRRSDLGNLLTVFEIDRPGPQAWKKLRLSELGYIIPDWLRFVPVDFEAGPSFWDGLCEHGFDPEEPSLFVSTGVSMYLNRQANGEVLRQLARAAAGSTFAMSFLLKPELLESDERRLMETVMEKAKTSSTPFLSLFAPDEIVELARSAGFKDARYVSAADIHSKYFVGRSDKLRAGHAEAFLIATT